MAAAMPRKPSVRGAALGLSAVRAGFGLAAIGAPSLSARVLGYPPSHMTATGRVFAGLFGVRELALAATVVEAGSKAGSLRRALVLNAACDLADAGVAARAILRREGVNRGALMTIGPAIVGASAWIVLHRAVG
jgi:hypothetical protein